MGVRVYTTLIPSHQTMITSLSTSDVIAGRTSLVIDFSATQHTDKHHLLESEVQSLLQYIQTHPQRSSIHVYVQSGIVSGTHRKLQSKLQSLGCRVTTKISL